MYRWYKELLPTGNSIGYVVNSGSAGTSNGFELLLGIAALRIAVLIAESLIAGL